MFTRVLAAEARAVYDAAPPALGDALAGLATAVDTLAAADVRAAGDRELLDAIVGLQRQLDRVAAVQLDVIGRAEDRDAGDADGAVTTASWIRSRLRLDPGDAQRRCNAARRLASLPRLRAALAAGDIRLSHVYAVTDAARSDRLDAVELVEIALVDLALDAPPRAVRAAMARVVEIADDATPDPEPTPPPAGPDPARRLSLWNGFDGTIGIEGVLDRLAGEALRTALDALDTPDPADTPPSQRRSATQRRADALGRLARLVLDHGLVPTQEQGVAPHFTVLIDLAALFGLDPATVAARLPAHGLPGRTRDQILHLLADLLTDTPSRPKDTTLFDTDTDTESGADAEPPDGADHDDDNEHDHAAQDVEALADQLTPPTWRDPAAAPQPWPWGDRAARHRRRAADYAAAINPPPPEPTRLRWTGPAPPDVIARLLDLYSAIALQIVLTAGPYRPVNLGRTMRCHPAWMRHALAWRHGHCRGPDCDRPPTWTQAHHVTAYGNGGDTNLADAVPLCQAHHTLVTTGRWLLDHNPDTGECTWTDPHDPTRPPITTTPWQNTHAPPPTTRRPGRRV